MKKIISLLSVVVLSAMLFIGCQSTGNNSNQQQQVQVALAAVQLAATTGTELELQSNPQYAIYFLGAEQALQTFSSGTNAVTVTTVESALQAAGVTNVVVASSITEAITLGDQLIVAQAGTNTTSQLVIAQEVCGAAAAGIKDGLTATGRATLHKKK